jgi:hypothetical protein
MTPPMVSFITWNRLGLTDRNLKALLRTDEDFELYLADNNSRDGTWYYLSSLSDPRIKSRVRFDANRGPVYAANYHLSGAERISISLRWTVMSISIVPTGSENSWRYSGVSRDWFAWRCDKGVPEPVQTAHGFS